MAGTHIQEIHGNEPERQEDEDCLTDCGYSTFTGPYPLDWRTALNKRIGIDHRLVVCLDPGGLDIQVTALVKDMGALTQEREIEGRQYKGGDLNIVLSDPDELYNPYRVGSLLHGLQWSGKEVQVGSWLVGTEKVLLQTRMKLREVTADRGETVWVLYDPFYDALYNYIRANDAGHLDLTDADGTTLDITDVIVDNSIAPIELWTVTMTGTGDTFDVEGSETGEDGSGNVAADFTSDSGAITISALGWGGARDPGDVVKFEAVNVHTSDTVVEVCRRILIDETDLVAGDLDTVSWAQVEADTAVFIITSLEFRTRTKILDAIRITLRHALITAFPSTEGKIKLSVYIPHLSGYYTWEDSLCSTWNLKRLATSTLDVYNVFKIRYDPDANNSAQKTRKYPATGDPNPSYDRYGFYREFMNMEMIGYAAGDESIIDRLLQEFYAFRADQRELFTCQCTLEDLHRELNDIVYVDSLKPTRQQWGIIYGHSKTLTSRDVTLKVLEADWLLSAGCGYAWCDVGHLTDSCWITW